jgi:hypothetical protein
MPQRFDDVQILFTRKREDAFDAVVFKRCDKQIGPFEHC